MKTLAMLLWTSFVIVACGCGDNSSPKTDPEEVRYDTYDVVLPAALLGDYSYGPTSVAPPHGRLGEFQLPAELLDFDDVRLVIGGSWVTGTMLVPRELGAYADTIDLFVNITLSIRPVDSPEVAFEATVLPPRGTPDSPADFLGAAEFSESRWWAADARAQLMGTDLIATLTYTRDMSDIFAILSPSYGTVTALRLEFDNALVLE